MKFPVYVYKTEEGAFMFEKNPDLDLDTYAINIAYPYYCKGLESESANVGVEYFCTSKRMYLTDDEIKKVTELYLEYKKQKWKERESDDEVDNAAAKKRSKRIDS